MSKKIVTCSECGHQQEYDPEMIASQQSDPEVARLIVDGTLKICCCDHCGAESGVYFQPFSLRVGHIGIITCVPPCRMDNDEFLRETARHKSDKILDSILCVFTLEELCLQAKLWAMVRKLQDADNRALFKLKYGG